MQKPPLVAVDTNFPILLAENDDDALDALNVVRERIRPGKIIVPPTALQELGYKAEEDPDPDLRRIAHSALSGLESRWKFSRVKLSTTEDAIVQVASSRILHRGLLPSEERNDAYIIAESAVFNSVLLVSNDSHLLQVDHRALGLLFRELDLPVPLIISPREIVRRFYR